MFFRSLSRKRHISNGALERSINTSLCGTNLGGRPYKHVIVTLDPNKFAEKKQKRLHIYLLHIRPRISLLKHSSLVKVPYLDYDRTVEREERISYPPDTKAFLYYSLSPGKPRIAGELRFRVTSSDDPASFESGSDLLRRNGLLWSRPLYSLSKHYPPLYEKLREDQFIPDDLDEALATIPKNSIQYSRNNVLYTFNDAFTVNFGARSQNFFIITEQGLERLIFYRLFFDRRRMYNVPPYTGSALARFERSTLPEHNGTRTVLLRLLKIITPVECAFPHYDNRICFPKEGELYHQKAQVWSVNIDHDVPRCKQRGALRGLQLLWDTY